MADFISQQNINQFRRLLESEQDPARRAMLLRLLADGSAIAGHGCREDAADGASDNESGHSSPPSCGLQFDGS
jgi:hypothetical protein